MKSFLLPITRISPRPEAISSWRQLRNVNWLPLLAALSLALIGLATIYSASGELEADYAQRQAIRIGVGLLMLVWIFLIDYHAVVDLAPLFYGLGMVLLLLVLGVGHEAGGARSWLALGPLKIQPSEFAKLATALLLTRFLAKIQRPYLEFKEILLTGAIIAGPMLLIALERDLGGAAMFLPMLAGLLLVSGIRLRQLLLAAILGALVGASIWNFGMHDYQRQRIASFLSPESDPLGAGYQARQSKIAIGSGQWSGRGYGQGTQSQLEFLPERHTDFIMAVLAEEWGFAGVLVVFSLYGLFFFAATRIALRSRDRVGLLLVVSWLSVLTFHVLYNTAMAIGLLPITGVPLPFLSYGGSFILVNFLATGLLLNIDYRRYVNR